MNEQGSRIGKQVMQKMKLRKLGLMPTLLVLLAVFGLAILVGVILLMMFVRTPIAHSPEQSSLRSWQARPSILAMTPPGADCGWRAPLDKTI